MLINQSSIQVSILMITYNHKDFIAQAIESVLMQKTNFSFELVIGDDVSTDGTTEICKSYQEKYPNIIKLMNYENNVGVTPNFINVYNTCSGKYVAILEGDDYWIDDNKLQMQFEYLNQNPSCNLVYTQSKDFHTKNNSFTLNPSKEPQEIDFIFTLHRGWFIRTATIMIRKNINLNQWRDVKYSLDYLVHLLCSLQGTIDRIDKVTTIYRRHDKGITNVDVEVQLKRMTWFNDLLKRLDAFSSYKFTKHIKQEIKNNNSDIFVLALLKSKFDYFHILFNASFFRILSLIKERVFFKLHLKKLY